MWKTSSAEGEEEREKGGREDEEDEDEGGAREPTQGIDGEDSASAKSGFICRVVSCRRCRDTFQKENIDMFPNAEEMKQETSPCMKLVDDRMA